MLYWKYILTSGLTLAFAYGLHTVDMVFVNAAHAKAIKDQEILLTQQCQNDKKVTEEKANVLLKNNDDLNAKLSAYKLRLRNIKPLSSANAANTNDGHTSSSEHAGQGSADAWLEYFADAERYRFTLISCQDFIKTVWAQNGQ